MQNCDHSVNGEFSYKKFESLMREKLKELSHSDDISGFEISSRIHMLANMLDALTNQKDNERGMSDPRMAILMRLMIEEKMGLEKAMTPTSLSKTRHVTKNTISSLIRGLEEQGFVTRELDQKDKRVFRLRITDKGRSLVNEEIPQRAKFMNSLFDGMTKEEQQQLFELLDKMREIIMARLHKEKKILYSAETGQEKGDPRQ